jgi:P4 family phage/plasmid primase-like protien
MAHSYKRGEFCSHILRYKVEKGSEFTHTSIIKPSGAFYIPTDEMESFYQNYERALNAGEDLYMTEKHRDISPFLIDLDFKFEKGDNLNRIYTKDVIETVIRNYCKKIADYVDIPDTYEVYLLEKPHPNVDKGVIKDGVHIIIPNIVTRTSVQFLIRKDLLPQLKEVFEHLKCVNNVDDIVDEAVIERNNWQMYGSKKPNCEPYKVSTKYVWDNKQDTLSTVELKETSSELVEILSIRNKYDSSKIKIEKIEVMKEFEKEASKSKKKMSNALQTSINTRKNQIENLEHVCKLVDLLNEERANNYTDWISLGWCLRNIDHRLLEKWVEFSKKSPKFEEGECEKRWNYMRDDGLGMGTLNMWAKKDNPEQYAEVLKTDISNLIYNSRNETHYDIAKVVHFMFKHEFVCASIKSNGWFQYKDHRWVPCDCGFTLNNKLSTDVFKRYSSAASDYLARASNTESDTEQSIYAEIGKKLNGIALKLKNGPFKENVMRECRSLFYIDKFEERLDSKYHLIGFENGVYDLELMEFREGRPEDYISFSTGCSYIDYMKDCIYAKQLDKFLSSVLTKPHIREYVLLLLASFLNGNIREERFHIWTGSGCHSIDTQIMMSNGTIRKVQDIQVGDKLMGDDSTARNVLQLFRGHADMYDVIPVKGDKFTVNGDHILSLKATNMLSMSWRDNRKCWAVRWKEFDNIEYITNKSKHFNDEDDAKVFYKSLKDNKKVVQKGDVLDIKLTDYLKIKKRIGERNFYLYRKAIEFPSQPIEIDPWFLGYWLGNGHSDMAAITTMFNEVVEKTQELYEEKHDINCYVKKDNQAVTLTITNNKDNDCFWLKFKDYNLHKNKHIPFEYLHNDRDTRMKLLAGILDSDGHYQSKCNQYELTFESEKLIDDTIYLVRSLGFACYKHEKIGTWTHNGVKKSGKYYRIQIVGEGIEDIPVVLPFKKAQPRRKKKDVTVNSFKIKQVENDNFYGFELDGNHRYLMGDFVVSHNSNGKSKMIDLFEQSFGDYCCKFPVTLLTQKRAASNAASSELARAKGKRFAVLQEPSEDEKLNVGLMKELSGGDKIMARPLYKEPFEFKPQFKMVLTCNHLPNVPSDDGGTWRRIRLVEFISRFVEDPDPEKPNEFPIDKDLSTKFVDWREQFMSLLIEYYKIYIQTGVKEPEEVLQCTREYQKNNDFYLEFKDDKFENNEMSFLSVNDAYTTFKYWQKENHSVVKVRKREFMNAIDKMCGKRVIISRVEGWKGFRVKSEGGLGRDEEQEHDDLN